MTIEEVRKKITQILSKEERDGCERDSRSSNIIDNQIENGEDVTKVRDNNGDRLQVHNIDEYHSLFGGSIFNGYIINGREMTRKEYLQYSRGLKHEEMLNHPLMYAMFRAEGQGEANFFEWLAKFKK